MEGWEEEIPISGRRLSQVLMVLLDHMDGSSAHPLGNIHWQDNVEMFGAIFSSWKGLIASINASSH